MIRFPEGLQNRHDVVIMSIILLVIGFFSMGMRFVNADPSYQTHYNVGYNDGVRNAECDSKHCHGHGYDWTVPSGHSSAYDNGYSKGYQDVWNKDIGDGKTQQSTPNATIPKSQEVSNNNHSCDPTHQFCAMTPP